MYSKNNQLLFLLLFLFSFQVFALEKSAPIVLVHGFFGWGRDEMSTFRYWGGLKSDHDIAEHLESKGARVITAAVGPFSSNWDRAIELYYQIKGGCVDYGAEHSAQFGHAQFGKCYAGFYPEWSEKHPVHLIGHSMGGQTIRTLIQLLADKKLSGGVKSVLSATSVSSPHNGATMADTPFFKTAGRTLILGLSALLNGAVGSNEDPIYDLKLDQWGLIRQKDESWFSYVDRVFDSPIWENNEDFSIYDLSTAGAKKLNSWVQTDPEVYYFSISNDSTEKDFFGVLHPRKDVNPLIMGIGEWIARVEDGKWARNDGVCNSMSMISPTGQPLRDVASDSPAKGTWNHILDLNGWDHLDTIGFCKSCKHLDLYETHWKLLNQLP